MAAESRPRRHCMVVYAYYPLAETRVQREAEALVDAGYAVDVLCLRKPGQPERERYRGVEVHRLPVEIDKSGILQQFLSYAWFLVLAGGRLTRLHLRRPYRSVQVHNLPDFLVLCALVPKLQGVPVILDLHDLMPEFFAARFGRRFAWVAAMTRWQERVSCAFADHVITVSEHWRQTLIRRGVRPGKCSVVMNVADERVFTPRERTADGNGFSLLYHGTIAERYGLDLAIRAVGMIRQEIPGIHLTIRGNGDFRPALLELRRRLGLESEVDLLIDFVSEEELAAIISAADVGVVPYRDDVFTDGIVPTKLMEYAAVGLPCVAARTSAIETYFADANVAFFQPGDVEDLAARIRELHASPERRAELAQGSRNFTERYRWSVIGGDYVRLIERLGGEA